MSGYNETRDNKCLGGKAFVFWLGLGAVRTARPWLWLVDSHWRSGWDWN
jgi:hypothetical protein